MMYYLSKILIQEHIFFRSFELKNEESTWKRLFEICLQVYLHLDESTKDRLEERSQNSLL